MAQTPLDPRYFNDDPWRARAQAWVEGSSSPFASADAAAVRRVAREVRVVVNAGPTALLALLRDEPYLNAYERPLVGGERGGLSPMRRRVDEAVGLVGRDTYFAALAVSGVGVRYYGEYCLVLDLAQVDDDPGLFDRDSYEIEYPPFVDHPERDRLVAQMSAHWDARADVLVLKVLPTLRSTHRAASTGVLADAVLNDQDFVEVHLHPDRQGRAVGAFTLAAVDEVRIDPVDVALADWLATRWANGELLADEERVYLQARDDVHARLQAAGARSRVVGGAAGGTRWT